MAWENSLPLTRDEHYELGRELRAVSARMRELCGLVVSVYGPNNQSAFQFQKATEILDRLRGDLQAQAGADLPGFDVHGYYD
ncbi:MAG: hypothetical protein ACLPX8_02145 [Bryobacteraceae bacterium]|jgi:hypothetical protein